MALAQAKCAANPKSCITTPEGLQEVAVGTVKGVPNTFIDLLNTGPTVVNGVGYIADVATGQELTQRITPLSYPSLTQPEGSLQELGSVLGSTATGGLLLWAPLPACWRRARARR